MAKHLHVRVLRQDGPKKPSYWEEFDLDHEPGMNITTVLQRIAALGVTTEKKPTTPVAYDAACLEEICGSCTMVINGRVRQACTALVDPMLKMHNGPIEIRPMTKFPVVRDLVVDRSRMFESLKRVKAWVAVDGYHDHGHGERIKPKDQEIMYPLSKCMTCGCCVEACPQYHQDVPFIGPAAISQTVLFNMNPISKTDEDARLAVLAGEGGIAGCGNSQNCVKVCPKNIPLTDSLAKAGRDATIYTIKQWFGR